MSFLDEEDNSSLKQMLDTDDEEQVLDSEQQKAVYHDIFKHQLASKLNDLPLGNYKVLAIKSVKSKFNGTAYLLLLENDLVVWSNFAMKKYINLKLEDFGTDIVENKLRDEMHGYLSMEPPKHIAILSCFASKFLPKIEPVEQIDAASEQFPKAAPNDSLWLKRPGKIHSLRFADEVFDLAKQSKIRLSNK